eukprot:GCRY01002183.1.p1 GENE.GCRY01002183.1~~GCRY01002183.1.p1  ORF type:complete len:180 (+),score=25.90 GCRY01002183.1:268-807(+)
MDLDDLEERRCSLCNAVDFLLTKCDRCHKEFCKDHLPYESHQCKKGAIDVRATVCPVCQQPISVPRGQDPNVFVNKHIAEGCPDELKRKKESGPHCCKPGCKKKELMPLECPTCHQPVCLAHRFEADHDCPGPPPAKGKGKRKEPNPKHKAKQHPEPVAAKKGAKKERKKNKKEKCLLM